MNFSTVPPYRPITRRAVSKYSERSSRTSSGSRDSDKGVKPTRSANNTDTVRRSATGEATVAGAAAIPSTSGAPHSPQNFLPGSFGVPQAGQSLARAAPHSPQNFTPAPFSAEQRGHVATRRA